MPRGEVVLKTDRLEPDLVEPAASLTDCAVYMLDASGTVVSWSASAQRLLGYSKAEIVGSCFSRFFSERDRTASYPMGVLRTASNDGRYEADLVQIGKREINLSARLVVEALRDDHGALIGFASVTIGLPEQTPAEQRLVTGQSKKEVGQLIGGVAHRFNNILNVIIGNIDALVEEERDPAEAKSLASDALGSAWRAAQLSHQLLSVSRNYELQPQRIDAGDFLRSMESAITRSVGSNIKISIKTGSDPLPVFVDPGQLNSAILNLVANAQDAMPQGGSLALECHGCDRDLSEKGHKKQRGLPYVCFSVADTAGAFADHILDRAFEPFVTTKRSASAIGLGLSMVYDFARQSGGTAEISCDAGRESQILIYLPRAKE